MAKKTRQATNALNLAKTIVVNDKTYNVNAVAADHVEKDLTIGMVDIDGNYRDDSFDYNGSCSKEVDIVSADGGRFNGPIRVPIINSLQGNGNLAPDGNIFDEAVLNYADLTHTVLRNLSNNSTMYSYNGTWPPTSEGSSTNGVINGLSVITGIEDDVFMFSGRNWEEYQDYREDPNNYKGIWLAAFLYVCSNSPFNIYFGTCEYEDAWRIASSASTLATPRTIRTDLSSTATASFDGSKNITPGVTGTLPVGKGGTGATNPQDAANSLITNIVSLTPKNIKVKGNLFKPASGDIANAEYSTYGIDLSNSDIIGVNGLWFNDYCNGRGEGIIFARETILDGIKITDSKYCDRLAAQDGNLYFYVKENLNMNESNQGNAYKVYHEGGPTIPVNKGGTGQTNLANVTVGKADTVKATYYSSANASANIYSNITIAPSSKYSNGIPASVGSNGDIMILF